MLISDAIFQLLTSDDNVAALIGGRAYPGLAPKETKTPCVVFSQIGGDAIESFQGTNLLSHPKFRFACYGSNYRYAKLAAAAVKNCVDGVSHDFTDGSQIQVAHRTFEGDDSEPIPQGTIYSTHLDYEMCYLELSA